MTTQRDRQMAAERRAWIDAEEAALRAKRDAPFIQAEQAFQATARQLALVEKQRVMTMKDDGFEIDDAVANATMSQADADAFNSEQAAIFASVTPEYMPSDSNLEVLAEYLARNGVQIINCATWKNAFNRLHSYGLLEKWPAPEPSAEDEAEPEPEQPSMEHEGYPVPKQLLLVDGYDPNGFPIKLPAAELDRMTAVEFRRFHRIPVVNKPNEPAIW